MRSLIEISALDRVHLYVADPDGNHLELTTYDHAIVRRWLTEKERADA